MVSALAFGLAMSVSGAPGAAQEGTPGAKDGPPGAAPKAAAANQRAAGPAAVPATSAQRVSRGRAHVASIQAASQRVQQQLQAAREERDVVRVLCLNDKLSQVDIALRSARDRLGALEGAREGRRSKHEYTVLQVLRDRAKDLVHEAGQCVGEESGFEVGADVTVTVDADIPAVNVASVLAQPPPPPAPRVVSGVE